MHLTWRDGVTALFAVVVGVSTLAVTQDWGWPLLGSYRAGIIALALVGVPTCLIGRVCVLGQPRLPPPRLILKDLLLTAAAALGLVAVAMLVVGLITGPRRPLSAWPPSWGCCASSPPPTTRSRNGPGSTSPGQSVASASWSGGII